MAKNTEKKTSETTQPIDSDVIPDTSEEAAPVEAQDQPENEPEIDLAEQLAQSKDQLLRALAEMENLRQRTEREVRESRQFAITGFARDLLAVEDNFERAMSAVKRETQDEAGQSFYDGIALTAKELAGVLEKHGVKKIIPLGERFDPNFHQAMFEAQDDKIQPGHVMQVVQPGYVLADRVLRPAMVGVAKEVKNTE